MNDERKIRIADLHIHTPSSRCYKDDKSESTYIEILKTCKNKNLSVIAITDHNSIEGYKKLTDQKETIQDELKVLESINDSQQASKKIKELKTKLSYYQDLLIIPGVEFEVNNGIHLLCLFNPDTPISKIEEFLNKGGYEKEDYGFENANRISKWDIFQFLEETKQYDCIVIDAHTDSDKGILETIKNGMPRASCLSNSQLRGLCYKSEKQRSLLEKTIQNSKEYQRDIPLAFLKSSDAHSLTEIAIDTTFFQLKDLNFKDFKAAFNNPLEYISTTVPAVKSIVERILKTGKAISINEFEDIVFDQYLCAFHNTSGGFIVIGVNELGGITGYPNDKLEALFKKVMESIKSLSNNIEYDINPYPAQNNKSILIINIKKGVKLIDSNNDGIIWVFESKNAKRLSAQEIEQNIEKRITDQLQRKIVNRLIKIESDSLEIKNSLFSFPIIHKFEQNSKVISSLISKIDYKDPLKLKKEQIELLKNYSKNKNNGKSKGNIFYFDDLISPRLNNAYLRLSIPKFYLKGIENHTKRNEQIIVTPGGATFYSTKSIEHYNELELGLLAFNSANINYSNKFICSFLKSSFFLWYFNFKYETVDFFVPDKFKLILFPKVYSKNPDHRDIIQKIEGAFDIILEKETEFLQKDLKVENDNYEEIIENHNNEIDKYSHEIDQLIYKLIDLTLDEINIIETSLNANNIYVPKNN